MSLFDVIIDIETIPTQSTEVAAELKANIQAPATYKKQESIDKWFAEEGKAAGEEAIAKTSFNGGFGEIYCIGLKIRSDKPVVLGREDLTPQSEKDILLQLNGLIGTQVDETYKQPFFIGHNVANFDLKFIYHRMAVNDIKPAFVIPWKDAPYKATYYDTMLEWAGYRDKVSLDNLCKYLGVQSPKTDLDGSKVWEYVKAGKGSEVQQYCLNDVIAVHEIYKRMTFAV